MAGKKAEGPVFMLLAKGGHREDGTEANPDRGFIIFVKAPDLDAAQNEALSALQDRNWHGVHLLRGGEVGERPAQEPHGTAWAEAREGRRGVIVYTTAQARASAGEGGSS